MVAILNIGIILSLYLGILLFTKKNKNLTDKILAFWLLVICIHLLGFSLYNQGYWEKFPHLIGLTVPIPFLHGPFLFLYVKYSLKNQTRLSKIDYLHFLPAFVVFVCMLPFYLTYSVEKKIQVDQGIIDDYGTFSNIVIIAILISGLTYVLFSYIKLLRREKIIDWNFSYSEGISLNWLRYSVLSIAGVFVSATIIVVLKEILQFEFTFEADFIFYFFIVAFVVYVGYSGVKQQGIFSNNLNGELSLVQIKSESEYKKSGLKAELAQSKHVDLLNLMTNEKPYLNPKLSLSELAQKLSISSNHLSQIINQYEKVNFHDFVNKYRINEFIKRAQSNKNFSILAHALDSGFNSKSSFNGVFKKLKNVTPSKYMAGLSK